MSTEPGYLLLVEDDPDILALLDTTLHFRDYRVVTALDGREALEIVHKEHPRIVIADIMMPFMDGYGLVHRLRIDPTTRNIPVVFITATYVSPEDSEFASKIGVARIIKKPVDLEMFLGIVNELLEGKPRSDAEPFDEFQFYDGYRQLLEAKLTQKIKHIAREEHLLEHFPGAGDKDIQESLLNAIRESDELKLLLGKINEQLERISK